MLFMPETGDICQAELRHQANCCRTEATCVRGKRTWDPGPLEHRWCQHESEMLTTEILGLSFILLGPGLAFFHC